MGNPYSSHGALELLGTHKRRDELRVKEEEEHHPDCDFKTPFRLGDFRVKYFHEVRLSDEKNFDKGAG